jgi:predicted metal-dependent HD superfamily phosphohydrolase/phosphopantetheine adenylyltransferase
MFKTTKPNLFIEKILKIPQLYFEKSFIHIDKINLENFLNNHYQYDYLLTIQNAILEKTESEMLINMDFDLKISKFSDKELYDVIQKLQSDIFRNSLNTKYIDFKRVIVRFPQIFQKKYLKDNENHQTEDLKTIALNNYSGIFFIGENLIENENLCSKLNIKKQELDSIDKLFLLENYNHLNKEKSEIREKNLTLIGSNDLFSYKCVALGGSFDHMHLGHNLLLSTAALNAENNLLVGITSDRMLSKKGENICSQPFQIREQNVRDYLLKIGYEGIIKIQQIDDSLGTTSEDANINALVITEETLKGAEIINQRRKENNLEKLSLIYSNIINQNQSCYDIVSERYIKTKDNNFQNKISSRKIRHFINSNSNNINFLYEEWNSCFDDLKNKSSFKFNQPFNEKILYWWSVVRDLYSQPWRKYHNLNHIEYSLKILKNLKDDHIKDYFSTIFAIWFHDIIYVPSRKDNEERSTDLFKKFYKDISIYIDSSIINCEKIEKYILFTKLHDSQLQAQNAQNLDPDLSFFLDIDLAILGEHKEIYLKYSRDLREEYQEFSDEQWNLGRKVFLEKLLKKQKIYLTSYFQEKYISNLKGNVEAELKLLI